jgi:transcriptional regulator with XRE-family HTH domain
MQAIEPLDKEINEAFPGYHPQWVMQSQRMTITPENFCYLRQSLLCISQEQCAAYLQVSQRTLRRWERGDIPIPFMAFELLRLVYESVNFRLSHPDWDGWFISANGELVSPDVGKLSFTPGQFNAVPQIHALNSHFEHENKKLGAELADAIAENTKLRQLFVTNGVVRELATMQKRLGELYLKLNTADVLQLTPQNEKAA